MKSIALFLLKQKVTGIKTPMTLFFINAVLYKASSTYTHSFPN